LLGAGDQFRGGEVEAGGEAAQAGVAGLRLPVSTLLIQRWCKPLALARSSCVSSSSARRAATARPSAIWKAGEADIPRGIYEYFSCLSRVQHGGRCPAPYFPVDATERAVVRRYQRETYTPDEHDAICQAVREYAASRAEVARRNSQRHARRLRELTGQQQKLLQAFYNGGVDEEVLHAEQERIETERTQARKWAEAAVREVQDVVDALDIALSLLDAEHVLYETLPTSSRRMVNQAIFQALIVHDPETIQAERTPLYEALASLNRTLQQPEKAPQTTTKRDRNRQNKDVRPQDDHDPFSWGRGSYIEQMAERAGFEPAMEFDPHTRLAGECLQPLGHLSLRSRCQCRAKDQPPGFVRGQRRHVYLTGVGRGLGRMQGRRGFARPPGRAACTL
jgi:hypothetical protein